MKIVYYMPFKPMGHVNPSGDLVIGTELFQFLHRCGVDITLVSRFRCRWIYLKPHLWPLFLFELIRVLRYCRRHKPDAWLSYHSYYKAPDLLGALCCRLLNIPYCLFQGIYSTKRRKRIITWPGFHLNRLVLQEAEMVFSNKKNDHHNLARLLPQHRLVYIAPGLHPERFRFDGQARARLRARYGAEKKIVILTAAMFRPGVKTSGILQVIASCGELAAEGCDLLLLVAGDGAMREELARRAADLLGERAVFVGRQERSALRDLYSAADIFAFPGIEESLGMVFLEAQSCRLPVVAYGDWGAAEAVVDGETGLLAGASEPSQFTDNLRRLADDASLRRRMGAAAERHVLEDHDLEGSYRLILDRLVLVAAGGRTAEN